MRVTMSLRIAIVGLGPWGLCLLERLVAHARRRGPGAPSVEVQVVEPALPGTGIYDVTLPDYLVMNNACGDVELSPREEAPGDGDFERLGLHAWATAHGYRWVDGACAVDPRGVPLRPGDFLPRRVMGEYLHWNYRMLVAHLPPSVRIHHHASFAHDVQRAAGGGETVALADGRRLHVDHVVLAFGHVENEPGARPGLPGLRMLAPYRANAHPRCRSGDARVAVNGQGLVATDVVIGLTQGQGGRFEESGGRLAYRASGREPRICLYSRSGQPYRAKSTRPSHVPERSRALTYGPSRLAGLRGRPEGSVDFRREFLPLLLREMRARHHLEALHEADGAAACASAAARLRALAAADGPAAMPSLSAIDAEIAALDARFGAFDPAALVFGEVRGAASSAECQALARDRMLAEATDRSGRARSVEAACETFRALRDDIRAVVEEGRLASPSHLDFFGPLRGAINRLVAGPPAWRLRQLVALVDAGVLEIPFGPAPTVEAIGEGRARVASTSLAVPCARDVDVLVRGHLEDPMLAGSSSPLVASLRRQGRLVPWCRDGVALGSLRIDADAHPVDADGASQPRLWLFGAMTEGARFFTHYLPSPSRGTRAFDDLDRCARALLA